MNVSVIGFRGFTLRSRVPVARAGSSRRFKATHEESLQYTSSSCRQANETCDQDSEGIVSRRTALSLLSAAALLMVEPSAFAEEQATEATRVEAKVEDEAPSTSYVSDFPDDGVPSNLKPKEYYKLLFQLRPVCWAAIARSLQSKDYDRLSLIMNQAPIADLRSAAKFTPWSLLQANEYDAAVASRKAFVDLEVHMKDLQQIAEATAMDGATPEQVQQSFILLNASFEQFIATLPSKFQ